MSQRTDQKNSPEGEDEARNPCIPTTAEPQEDASCWVCGSLIIYRQCKIVCPRCGFTRDCSDP